MAIRTTRRHHRHLDLVDEAVELVQFGFHVFDSRFRVSANRDLGAINSCHEQHFAYQRMLFGVSLPEEDGKDLEARCGQRESSRWVARGADAGLRTWWRFDGRTGDSAHELECLEPPPRTKAEFSSNGAASR